jgi:IQ calmodulin-binding motif
MQIDYQIQELNKQAMDQLRYQNYEIVLECLTHANELLSRVPPKYLPKLQTITYNNFGCYYKSIGKNEIALKYLKKTLKIEKTQNLNESNLAGTYLNLSAIYSQIGNHTKALSQAILALKLLKNSCTYNNLKNISALIIALHNTGIEYEFLGNIEKAASTFKYGLQLSQEYLGNKHELTASLLKSFLAITTTGKKYYFEKSRITPQSYRETPTIKFPKVSKIFSQENSPNSFQTHKKGKKKSKIRHYMQTAENSIIRQELPLIEKPRTFEDKLKKSPHSEYVNALEEKINFLQSQLVGFEKRYKNLETIVEKNNRRASYQEQPRYKNYSGGLNKAKAAIMIQKHWRGYITRKKIIKVDKINKKNTQTKKIPDTLKPNTKKTVSLSPKRKSYETYRKSSLPPIAEAKFESKSQKAILIQSHIRRYLAQKRYKNIKLAVIKIQNFFKKILINSLFKKVVLAIKFIQRHWRAHRKKRSNPVIN